MIYRFTKSVSWSYFCYSFFCAIYGTGPSPFCWTWNGRDRFGRYGIRRALPLIFPASPARRQGGNCTLSWGLFCPWRSGLAGFLLCEWPAGYCASLKLCPCSYSSWISLSSNPSKPRWRCGWRLTPCLWFAGSPPFALCSTLGIFESAPWWPCLTRSASAEGTFAWTLCPWQRMILRYCLWVYLAGCSRDSLYVVC